VRSSVGNGVYHGVVDEVVETRGRHHLSALEASVLHLNAHAARTRTGAHVRLSHRHVNNRVTMNPRSPVGIAGLDLPLLRGQGDRGVVLRRESCGDVGVLVLTEADARVLLLHPPGVRQGGWLDRDHPGLISLGARARARARRVRIGSGNEKNSGLRVRTRRNPPASVLFDRPKISCFDPPLAPRKRATLNRRISRRSGWPEINRLNTWTFQRFCAQIVAGPLQGEKAPA
jgi:hypothetical protein